MPFSVKRGKVENDAEQLELARAEEKHNKKPLLFLIYEMSPGTI